MRVPDEYRSMMRNLDSNTEYIKGQVDSLVRWALSGSSKKQRAAVKRFLDVLLSEHRTYEELQEVWWSGPVEIDFVDEEKLRAFFVTLRDKLASET